MDYIGTIHSPFTSLADMPVQPKGAAEKTGTVIIDRCYQEGLRDLEGFSHIYLIYHFHKASRTKLSVTPFLDTTSRGVFATRSPLRPNHIGLSVVELVAREENVLTIKGLDILDGTPLLDIKPYIEAFDAVEKSRSGWFTGTGATVRNARSDTRFT